MSDAGSATGQAVLEWERPREWPELRRLAEGLLAECDERLRAELPDWIGHVKALVATGEGAAYASLTGAGEPVTWRGALGSPAARATVTLYAIVWAAPEELARAIVDAALERLRHHL
ncbi:MAG: hypothetical protein RLZZ387_271 [Chloroflexota bacterium]|jgi:hypothetical protein